MRKSFYIVSATVAIIFSACSSSKANEQAKADSAFRADSIAAVEAAEQAAEQARLDSIRQDSIQRVEEFKAAIPTFAEVNGHDYSNLFKKKGFTVTYGKGEGENEYHDEIITIKVVIANLKLDEQHYCEFKEYSSFKEGDGYKMTIVGAPEKLEAFAKAAKANLDKERKQNPGDWYFEEAYVKINGNTVNVHYPMGD